MQANIPKINTFDKVVPMIYAYNTPGVTYHDGWTKIGYTEKQSVEDRIRQQTHTAGIQWELAWQDNAMYKDGSGEYFTDHDFHSYLEIKQQIEREPKTEWFKINGMDSLKLFQTFARGAAESKSAGSEYILRDEQSRAVKMTSEYFAGGGTEFLWNAKPRFGKTLAAYDLVRTMGLQKVLIVTNRPSIANSWADDFMKFIGWRGELAFVSETDALKDHAGVMTRKEYLDERMFGSKDKKKGMIAFESLQGLKGSVYFGGEFKKLQWIKDNEFDLLIVDESQEGVDTFRTSRAFKNIKRKHTLYLSGTPFKALASEQFREEQIFNWSYADEQAAKENWSGEDYNPYERMPRLNMFTYRLSDMIYDKIKRGVDISDDGETSDYAFDLNEFFITNESGKFVHEDDVRKFLHSLTTFEKYPFSTPELRRELSHTMWILNRVASAKALAKLLKDDEFRDIFGEYEIVLAAGDGKLDDDAAVDSALARVRKAIAEHDKTITLTVGQLTVGITVPEWSGVLMLCNMQSPSSYMQAAFRPQNPCTFTQGGQRWRKENAYVFDFDPARTLIIFDEFANNLSPNTASGRGTSEQREENIKRLLNFFPVLGEDDEGRMVQLDEKAVLSIPRRIKCTEVVRHGFMSNFLFQNIGNIFGAPSIVKNILEKFTPAQEDPKRNKRDGIDRIDDVNVDDEGNVQIPNEIVIGKTQDLFGDKIYEVMSEKVDNAVSRAADEISSAAAFSSPTTLNTGNEIIKEQTKSVAETLKEAVAAPIIEKVAEDYGFKKSEKERITKQVENEIERTVTELRDDCIQQTNIAKAEFERKQSEADTAEERKQAEQEYQAQINSALQALNEGIQKETQRIVAEKPQELVAQAEKKKEESEKKGIEDDIRAHLRGFARTIPSFIMAYGTDELVLANFDTAVDKDVFYEVTGITLDEFRFLRDGGDYTDEATGETQHFDGHLFDEVVFNDSLREFMRKRTELANYFDESHEEDIFDYIPPQKTNQIFTPRWVVQKMVDELEINNPGCFDDSDKTFADLYMKSGLYITEIVKRLYRSEKMKELFPDDKDRIRHIINKQVYGIAPTQIIYLIATNYILGFDDTLKTETSHFAMYDTAEAAKNGTLQAVVDELFEGK
ncbi:MAG: DEAD/DEAH box helicase family protein [Ruminiclostridium sp.]|nr:DEAD/DEAH box helicase family protein [Ruminiclostridium sp.]